jgi:hypothetical protein
MIEEPDFTPRNVAKWMVKATVQFKATKLVRNALVDYTEFESDDLVVKISSNVIGWGVSAKLQPVTDKLVDKTADFIVAKREEKKQKDQEETPDEQ